MTAPAPKPSLRRLQAARARRLDWTRLSDEQLLQLRICDLRLDPAPLAVAALRAASL
jgi:hypothetical protein